MLGLDPLTIKFAICGFVVLIVIILEEAINGRLK